DRRRSVDWSSDVCSSDLFEARSTPAGNGVLPEEMVAAYREFLTTVERAARAGVAAEDYSTGEPRMADPAARALQDRFAAFAADNLELLRDVLRNASEAEQRGVAHSVIGSAPKNDQVLNDLHYAFQAASESADRN